MTTLPTITLHGQNIPLHVFFFRELPRMHKAGNTSVRGHLSGLAADVDALRKVLEAVEPLEGKKTKTPYEDAIWALGMVLEVGRREGAGNNVFIGERDDLQNRRLVFFSVGGVRGLVEGLRKALAEAEKQADEMRKVEEREEERQRYLSTFGGIDFSPLTEAAYWRQTVVLANQQNSYGSLERPTLQRLRELLPGGPVRNEYTDAMLTLYSADLMERVYDAIRLTLDEVAALEQVFSPP